MDITITPLHTKLPDPEFATLQRKVFAEIQRESSALAEVLSGENTCANVADLNAAVHAPMLRLGRTGAA